MVASKEKLINTSNLGELLYSQGTKKIISFNFWLGKENCNHVYN